MPRFARLSTIAALLLAAVAAYADIRIGVIASSTGPTAVVGIPQKNTVALLPAEIGGQKVDYIVLDDASDPTNAVTGVKKLITEHKVDALIGPTTAPAALAMLAVKLALAGAGLALIETLLAKMRIFLVAEFLSTAFLLAVLGMLTHFLVRG